ncbi:hypothetical protein ACN4EG_09365 [Alkalinema pantanalense CENA528]|uniref:hypothetical protein n=1 Tax=Alkalinema pantanalense TaxID=1620705 RepID=UPI003D6E0708
MLTFLLVWNSQRWHWQNIEDQSQAVQSGKLVIIPWSCGNSKNIHKGDRVFFTKLGQAPKGIFASGYVIQASFKNQHWDAEQAAAGETAMFITVQLDTLLNPATSSILPRQLLETDSFQPMHWDSQRSGIQIPANVAATLETEWENFSRSLIES